MAKPRQPLPTLEQALCELEQIVSDIETGQLGLEENLTRYERGRFLIQHCLNGLDQAQRRIDASAPANAHADDSPIPPVIEPGS